MNNTSQTREEPTESDGWRSVVRDVLAGLRGATRDYTEGALGRSILVLAVPMVLEMFMQSVFAVADAWFIGQLGSKEAVAAVGVTESMLSIIFAVGLGLAMGTTATIARRIGEKRDQEASVAAIQAIAMGLALSVVLGSLGAWFSKDLMRAMGASQDLVAAGHGYAAHILGGSGTILMLFLINAVFRGAGDPALAMRALWLANLINIMLDPILIFGLGPIPALGVTGAAIATNIGRGIGVLYQLSILTRGLGRLQIHRSELRIDPATMIRLIRVSAIGIVQFLLGTASYVGLVRVLTALGNDAALAGYTIAVRVLIFALLPGWGIANAAATLVGQNLGAGKAERAERAVWTTGRYNMVFLGTVGILLVMIADPVVRLFIDDPAVIEYGARCLRIISVGYFFFAWGMVMMQAFNGSGDTTTPSWINFLFHWVFKIPLAVALAAWMDLGPTGVFIAIPVAEGAASIAYITLFRRGRWKERTL